MSQSNDQDENSICKTPQIGPKFKVAEPHDLSPRAKWLREYYFKGNEREWNNEYMPFTIGEKWGDRIWNEGDFYIVPDTYAFIGENTKGLFNMSLELMAQKVTLPNNFWQLSLPERRALFFQIVMIEYIPKEIISSNDLIAGGRFNTQLSKCLNEKEYKQFEKENLRNRHTAFKYHRNGFGNVGATGGHLIADYKTVIEKGFKYFFEKAKATYNNLTEKEKKGPKGQELRAMMISAETPKLLAAKYAEECRRLINETSSKERKQELKEMAENLERVPWEPAETFWQAIQGLWIAHMLIIAEESYPGPGTSFGRLDQILWKYYEKDVVKEKKIDRDTAKDIFSSFIFHCNTAYDAQIKIGKQGITSGFGQLMTLSGLGSNGEDLTNELTYMILETFDEWAPILEPKPNVRLHKNTPERLYEVLIDMITRSQGAPFILNFDERSIAGLVLEGIPENEAWDYGCVGCLENTLCGNDRSGTVNCNPNLAKSIELTLWNGKNMAGFKRPTKANKQIGPKTGKPETFETWEQFFTAWKKQMEFLIKYTVKVYNQTELTRAKFMPTPYVSILMDDCIEKGVDIRAGPPKYGFMTIEGVAYATTVDSLLAIKHFVYDTKEYTIADLKEALQNNFQGKMEFGIMQAKLTNKAPKYGNDEDGADKIAQEVMEFWANETWKYKTPTNYQFRPGMLSWNYWAGNDAFYTIATPNGRNAGTFLSNAICPTNGADLKGPTAVTNSVGIALGGKESNGDYRNVLPNGASHTISFNPSLLKNEEHRQKFKAFLKGYLENGGTALQINIIDSEMLKEAQKHPENYTNLLVRVTGYNAYFTAIGKELQYEIISREAHNM
ncbi:MAG: pyruvate formate lyase family protein [Candidatus Thorarchaeota archaeon]